MEVVGDASQSSEQHFDFPASSHLCCFITYSRVPRSSYEHRLHFIAGKPSRGKIQCLGWDHLVRREASTRNQVNGAQFTKLFSKTVSPTQLVVEFLPALAGDRNPAHAGSSEGVDGSCN